MLSGLVDYEDDDDGSGGDEEGGMVGGAALTVGETTVLGKRRRWGHVEGQWTCVAYIAVPPDVASQLLSWDGVWRPWMERLTACTWYGMSEHGGPPATPAPTGGRECVTGTADGDDGDGMAYRAGGTGVAAVGGVAEGDGEAVATGATGATAPLHISLTRTFTLRHAEIDSLVTRLRTSLRAHPTSAISVTLSGGQVLVNEDGTRSFAAVMASGDGIISLIHRCDRAMAAMSLPLFYVVRARRGVSHASTGRLPTHTRILIAQPPEPHVSLLWTPGDANKALTRCTCRDGHATHPPCPTATATATPPTPTTTIDTGSGDTLASSACARPTPPASSPATMLACPVCQARRTWPYIEPTVEAVPAPAAHVRTMGTGVCPPLTFHAGEVTFKAGNRVFRLPIGPGDGDGTPDAAGAPRGADTI